MEQRGRKLLRNKTKEHKNLQKGKRNKKQEKKKTRD